MTIQVKEFKSQESAENEQSLLRRWSGGDSRPTGVSGETNSGTEGGPSAEEESENEEQKAEVRSLQYIGKRPACRTLPRIVCRHRGPTCKRH